MYRLAEMCGRWDVEAMSDEVPIRAVLGWARYWSLKGSRIGSLNDPEKAAEYVKGLIGAR